MGNVSDQQLAQIAKANAPKKLGEINLGKKKSPTNFWSNLMNVGNENQNGSIINNGLSNGLK